MLKYWRSSEDWIILHFNKERQGSVPCYANAYWITSSSLHPPLPPYYFVTFPRQFAGSKTCIKRSPAGMAGWLLNTDSTE